VSHDTTRILAGLAPADNPVERIAALHAAAIDPDAAEFDSVLEILADAGCYPRAGHLWGHATAVCPGCRLRTLELWYERIAPARTRKRPVIRWRNAVLECSRGCGDTELRDELGLTLVDIFPRHFREAA
jgi:hypothetical protein